MIRRSRCMVSLMLILVVHLLLLSFFNHNSPFGLGQNFTTNLFDLRSILFRHVEQDRQRFNLLVDDTFRQLYTLRGKDPLPVHQQVNWWLLNSTTRTAADEEVITLPGYMVLPQKYTNPRVTRFDPRFTSGILLDYFTDQLEKKTTENLEMPVFHWADWVDLSDLNPYFVNKDKETCKGLFNVATPNRNRNKKMELKFPEEFCIDDKLINTLLKDDTVDKHMKELLTLIKAQHYSTGFHVYGYGGRSKKRLKILHAKSYLNDFMPPPMSVVFLLPNQRDASGRYRKLGSNGFQVPVTQSVSDRLKLVDTPLVKEYVSKYMKENPKAGEKVQLNLTEQLVRITKLLASEEPDTENDAVEYNRILLHEDFVDRSREILVDLESKFEDTLTPMDKVYMETLRYSLKERRPSKYFNEAKLVRQEEHWALGAHYDWRFFNGVINYSDKQAPALYGLLKAWLDFTNTYKINTWIAHGSLLAWYWDGISFPWDNDIDVQMPINDLHRLSRQFNQSLIVSFGNGDEEIKHGRYFLDCSSYISSRSNGNGNNNIDARFIDVDSGYYIDITGLALSRTRPPSRFHSSLPRKLSIKHADDEISDLERNSYLQAYNCKNNHFATLSELTPLKLTFFDGEAAYVPNNFQQLLVNEYGEYGIEAERFHSYSFLPKLRLWALSKLLKSVNEKGDKKMNIGNVRDIRDFTEEHYMKLFEKQHSLLVEYMITRNATAFHEIEMNYLTRKRSTEFLLLDSDKRLKAHFPSLRPDAFNYNAFKEEYSYEKSCKELEELALGK